MSQKKSCLERSKKMTQKDVHNIFVKADMSYKAELIKQCDYDIEKIKQKD